MSAPSLALPRPSTAICNRDPDCDRSSGDYWCTPPARFHAAAIFHHLFGWAGSWQGEEEWSETNIEPSVRLTLFDLCATTAVAPYGLLKSDARRMQLLRVETCLHAWTLLSWSYSAVALAGGMILLHACVTCSSPSRYLHLRVFKSLTLPETVRMEHLQAVKLCCNICVTQPGRADLPCLGAPGVRMLYSRSLNSFTHEPPVLARLRKPHRCCQVPGSSGAQGSHNVSCRLRALIHDTHAVTYIQ